MLGRKGNNFLILLDLIKLSASLPSLSYPVQDLVPKKQPKESVKFKLYKTNTFFILVTVQIFTVSVHLLHIDRKSVV